MKQKQFYYTCISQLNVKDNFFITTFDEPLELMYKTNLVRYLNSPPM